MMFSWFKTSKPPATNNELLSEFHHLAKDFLERALQYDESGSSSEAISHYRKGLEVMHEGLAIKVIATSDAQNKKYLEDLSRWQTESAGRLRILESKMSARKPVFNGSKEAAKDKYRRNVIKNKMVSRSKVSQEKQAQQPTGEHLSKLSKPDQLTAMIETEILDTSPAIAWSDIAGLQKAKQLLKEMVILPATRPDIFKGLRAPTKGLLLYGPPGNGKTMLAKAVASESDCTFFAISASTLTSKWVGEAEKLVRKLFEIANKKQPSIIFIDEIDSVLSARSSNENESSRRLKTEFLIQFDGVNKSGGQVFVLGATNRPQELDDAVRRRLAKRIYIPLPDNEGRRIIIQSLLKGQKTKLTHKDMKFLEDVTQGYSASDIKELCHEAAMMGIRELSPKKLATISEDKVRPLMVSDFKAAFKTIKPSVSPEQLSQYDQWTKAFGTST